MQPYKNLTFLLNVYSHILCKYYGDFEYLHYGLFKQDIQYIRSAQQRATDPLFHHLPLSPFRILEIGIGLGIILTSSATLEDGLVVHCEPDGSSRICLIFYRLPLLKGEYMLSVHLLCERGLHIYDSANGVATLQVKQEGRLQGYFMMPHSWKK